MIYATFHRSLVCHSFDEFLEKSSIKSKQDSLPQLLTPREERLLQEVRLAFNVGRRMVVCNHNDNVAYIIQPWQAHYEEVYGVKPPKALNVVSIYVNPLGNSGH